MSDNDIRYLLGIDGGGTKTEFVLSCVNGNEIARAVLGGSNPVNIGVEGACGILEKGILQVCEGVDLGAISVFAGLAGGGSESIKEEINAFLSSFGFGVFANGSDTENAVQTALKGKNGVAVIMGTGIVAFGSLDGALCRAGGWGYMVDKGGSAFCFGSDALNAAFEYLDGRGESAAIYKLVEEKLSKPLKESVADIYGKGTSFVASFAPVVFEAYNRGDKTAAEIIDRNCLEAAKIIRAAGEESDEKKKNVVILGGLGKQKEILLPFISKHLGEGYTVEFSSEPAVNGALAIAKSNISE